MNKQASPRAKGGPNVPESSSITCDPNAPSRSKENLEEERMSKPHVCPDNAWSDLRPMCRIYLHVIPDPKAELAGEEEKSVTDYTWVYCSKKQ